MISQLTIQNFALIDRIEIEFRGGMNVFTGETGAGKSILIDALHAVLGKRLTSSVLRDNDSPCIIEALFELSSKQLAESAFFSEYTRDDEPILIINRTYFPDGRNKIKINGFSVTISQLRTLGNNLIDFHGPHDHQMLFSEESHIRILDRLCDFKNAQKLYAEKYTSYSALQKELDALRALSKNKAREEEILEFQIKELEQVPLDSNHYERVIEKETRANNSETLQENAAEVIGGLENEHNGLASAISRMFPPLGTLQKLDETTAPFSEILERIQNDCSELASQLNDYLDKLSFDPEETAKLKKQYDIYYEILRKYGPEIENAKNYYEKVKQKYNTLLDLEHSDASLKRRIARDEKELNSLAKNVTDIRKQTAEKLKRTIERELQELGISGVRFECRVEKTDLSPSGQNKVTLFISPNVGEGLKPLAKIVSSGEAARVMLALKKALTKVDPIPVLIFDEIDAQIGGRLGTITGKKLKELAEDRQVILITHLPQIASFGARHYKVSKHVKNDRTVTEVTFLNKSDRVKELAQMMSGRTESQIAIEHASHLLDQATR
ncbi:MAG: DNA repair protein RecN [Candidatus Omnitrophica bacterium]|nr:DNA repair protein RecN [Candidatus Omnitrophota bacterium]